MIKCEKTNVVRHPQLMGMSLAFIQDLVAKECVSPGDRYYLMGDKDEVLIAIDDANPDEVLGYAQFNVDKENHYLWISHIYVKPEARKTPAFVALMQAAQKIAEADETVYSVQCLVHTNNGGVAKALSAVGMKPGLVYYSKPIPRTKPVLEPANEER